MKVSILLCGAESWAVRKADVNKITTAEIRFLRTVKECSRLDMLRTDPIYRVSLRYPHCLKKLMTIKTDGVNKFFAWKRLYRKRHIFLCSTG